MSLQLRGGAGGGLGATSSPNITGRWVFTTAPEVHAQSGDTVPINARTFTDGKTVGAWNAVMDGVAGDLFHFTTGPNTDLARTVTDLATTNGSTTVTSATAAFTTGTAGIGEGTDVGKAISGTGIPANATITAVVSATQATISSPATATATGVTAQIGLGNANGAVIAIGIDNAAAGVILVNKHKGVGLNIRQRSSVKINTAYAMQVVQESSVCDAVVFRQDATASKSVVRFDVTNGTAAAGTPLVEWGANSLGGSTLAGRVYSDTGNLVWSREVQSKAANSSATSKIYAADEIASNATEAYLTAKTTGTTGMFVRRNSTGASGAAQFFFQWENETAAADKLKLKVSRGSAQPGAEVYSTMIEVRAAAGTGNFGQMGFFGVTPANRPSAYTQTYATADKTLAAYTPDTENVAYTGAADGEAKLADLNALRVAVENQRAFTEDVAQMLNSVIDDLQALGLAQ